MFSSQTVLNGVVLPAEFNGCNIANNIAVSKDGTRYAVVKPGRPVIFGDVPEDGVLNIDNSEIRIGKGGRGVSISSVISQSFQSVGSLSGMFFGARSVTIGRPSEVEINETYEGVREVETNGSDSDVELRLHDLNTVKIVGSGPETPTLSDGKLSLSKFEGAIYLPRSGVKIDVRTSSGDISGELALGGSIRTSSGEVSLTVRGPVSVSVVSSSGDVEVIGMIAAGKGRFNPPSGSATNSLSIRTSSGDVDLEYR